MNRPTSRQSRTGPGAAKKFGKEPTCGCREQFVNSNSRRTRRIRKYLRTSGMNSEVDEPQQEKTTPGSSAKSNRDTHPDWTDGNQ
ncbi:hypothetical protein QTP70_029293, partial [Hemibagrus guttatus]